MAIRKHIDTGTSTGNGAGTGSTVRTRAFVAVGGVLAAVLFVGGCGSGSAEDAEPEHRTFSLGGGKTLKIDSDDSALEVVAADVKDVEVTRWFDGETMLGSDPKATWEMKGDRLMFRMKCAGVVADCDVKHRVEVPRGVRVEIGSHDGSVTAEGFATDLRVRSADGRVSVKGTSGALDVGSEDGAVEVAGDVRSRDVRATSQDGRVRVELGAVPDRVDVDSEDGSVDIGLPKATYKVTTDVRDGGTEVSVPRDDGSAHVVDVRSRDGRVTVRTVS